MIFRDDIFIKLDNLPYIGFLKYIQNNMLLKYTEILF